MKLISAQITGYKRLQKTNINLDEDLIAIIGPNEAGKSSLLDALYSIENQKAYRVSELSRGNDYDDDQEIVTLLYALEPNEQSWVKETQGLGEPRWFHYSKSKDGSRHYKIEPEIIRDKRFRDQALRRLNRLLTNSKYSKLLGSQPEPEKPDTLRDIFSNLLTTLSGVSEKDKENLSSKTTGLIQTAINAAEKCESIVPASYKREFSLLIGTLEKLQSIETSEHPEEQLASKLLDARPRFLKFLSENRLLSADYPTSELNNAPKALENLLKMANTSSAIISQSIKSQDHANREFIQQQANNSLEENFTKSWGQSKVHPYLQIDTEMLRVMINDPNRRLALIAESSDGLRAFIALVAFIALGDHKSKPIVLIDEAEMHLHYDAQADLIRVFENQTDAQKIIFTTHSAGCLPSDLGTGVRGLSRIQTLEGDDSGTSEVKNSFWTESAGFSPLLIAMGASALSFSPTRRALLVEGTSDMILLPAMFREVNSGNPINFQIAPGLASVQPEMIRELDLEAPRVCYLVDGDRAGKEHKDKLIQSGVNPDRILTMPENFATEGFLANELYVVAVNRELNRSHGANVSIGGKELLSANPSSLLAEWCKAKKIKEPNKSRVATHTLSIARGDPVQKLLNPEYQKQLVAILTQIRELLDLQQPKREEKSRT